MSCLLKKVFKLCVITYYFQMLILMNHDIISIAAESFREGRKKEVCILAPKKAYNICK